MGLPELQEGIEDEGIPFAVVVTLFEDTLGNRPPTDDDLGADYAEAVGIDRELPVTVDLSGELIQSVPFQDALPSKCVLTDEMVILHCWNKVDNTEGLDAIRADFGG